jgi:hypothetical protein
MARAASFEAQKALNAIAAHEKECATSRKAAQQWRDGTSKTLDNMKDDWREDMESVRQSLASAGKTISEGLGGVYRRLWWGVGGLLLALFTVMMLLVGVLLKHPPV